MTTHELRAALIAAEKEEKVKAEQDFIASFEPFLGKYFLYGVKLTGKGEFLGRISYAPKSKTKKGWEWTNPDGSVSPPMMEIPTRTVQINLYDVKDQRTAGIIRDEQRYASFSTAYQLSEHHIREVNKELFDRAWNTTFNIALECRDRWFNPETPVAPVATPVADKDPLPGRKVYLPPTTT